MSANAISYGNRSLAAMALTLMATQDFYPIVLLAHDYGQNAAWMLALLSAVLTALMVWPVAAVIRRLPKGSLIELVEAAVGKAGLVIYALLVAGLFAYSGGLVLRQTSEMALSAFFPHTPQTVATTALLLGSVYAALGDGSSLVRHGRLLLGLILTAILVIIFGTTAWGNPRYLLPFWGPGPARLLLGAPEVTIKYGPVMVVFFLLTSGLNERSKLTRWSLLVPLMAGALFALVKADLVMVYAFPLGRNVPYPLHEAARLIVGGRFFERLEGVWLMVWVLATMLYLGTLVYAAALIFTRAFGMPRTRTAVLPLAGVVLTVAFFPPDQATTIAWHKLTAPGTFVITLLVPLLLAGLAAFRLRGRSA